MNELNAEIKAKNALIDETMDTLARLARELDGLILLKAERKEAKARMKAAADRRKGKGVLKQK